MSPPDTNLEKQKTRHRGPLTGIVIALGFVVILIVVYMLFLGDGAPDEQLGGTEAVPAGQQQESLPAPAD